MGEMAMKLLVTKEGKAAFAVGIVLVLSGLLMTNPVNEGSVIVSVIIGITALVKGSFEIYLHDIFFKRNGKRLKQLMTTGIVNIIIGLVMTVPPYPSLKMSACLFSFMYISGAVTQLTVIKHLSFSGNDYYAVLAGLNYVALAMGIFLLLSPLFSDTLIKWLVAVYLIVAGFVQIVGAFYEPKTDK